MSRKFMFTLPQTNIAMENGSFEDVFPIEHGDILASYVSLPEGIMVYPGKNLGKKVISVHMHLFAGFPQPPRLEKFHDLYPPM